MDDDAARFVVVGGGIAGVSCAETLSNLSEEEIVLITSSPVVKAVTNVSRLTKFLTSFDVHEVGADDFRDGHSGISLVHDAVTSIDPGAYRITTASGRVFKYKKLCLCLGASPKVQFADSPFVLGIRDTESVHAFQEKLRQASRIVILGNGGIATELVYALRNVDVVWAIKDESISATFVDAGAAEFFTDRLECDEDGEKKSVGPSKRTKYVSSDATKKCPGTGGVALGPDWHLGLEVSGSSGSRKKVLVQRNCTAEKILSHGEVSSHLDLSEEPCEDKEWNAFVQLSNGNVFGCDFVVSATGVFPNGDSFGGVFSRSEDGAIRVDENMRTSVEGVFAAGDVCQADFNPRSKHWFQMRLWTQARQMGQFAAQCMMTSEERIEPDFCFELFTHVTSFFGYKVVLLGLFNGQGLGTDYEILLRMTKGKEYVKAVMKDGRMQGAILIGETDLEETFENLILNQIDVSSLGEGLLDPDVDIEDYFD